MTLNDHIEHAGHARDFVRTIQLDQWSGIVLASGDGLIFEVIMTMISIFMIIILLTVGHQWIDESTRLV